MGILPLSMRKKPIARVLCRRLAKYFTGLFAAKLRKPVLVFGFNNSAKSSMIQALLQIPDVNVYPDEGNAEFWFPGFFPWAQSNKNVLPIWYDPEEFVRAVVHSRQDGFRIARSYLGAYQWLTGGECIVNESGMLAAILPDVSPTFPDAQYIHIQRDGRVVSYLHARQEWSLMMRSPLKYKSFNIEMNFQDVLRRVANYWAYTISRIDEVANLKGKMFLEVRYETWCQNPDKTIQEISNFIGCSSDISSVGLKSPIGNMNAQVLSEFTEEDISTVVDAIGPTLSARGEMWGSEAK